MDLNPVALLFMVIIGIVLTFAQVKLFSIDKTLKEIRSLMESPGNKDAEPFTNPLSIK